MNRRAIVRLAVAGVFIVLVAIFHRQLIGWFTGKPVGAAGAAAETKAGPFAIAASLDPDPPGEKAQGLVLDVKNASGAAVDGATVDVSYDMPAMGAMAEMKGTAKVTSERGGRYRAVLDLPMGGSWTLLAHIHASDGDASASFTFTVGTRGLSARAGATEAIDHYTCSMHPSVNQPGPGKCPICGMDLTPVMKGGAGVVTIDEARRQTIGVRTAAVISAPMHVDVSAIGQVAYDETGLTDVTLKTRGWITALRVDKTGQRVARGQPLFSFYSPELLNAEQDFLVAARGAMADAGTNGGFLAAARARLRLLDVSDAQIDAIAKSGTPSQSVTFFSPAHGYVIEKNVVAGASVEPGMRLFRIAALDRVWIDVDLYEADLGRVRVGQRAEVTLDYTPGRFEAKVAWVYPFVDPKSRTGRVRVELKNDALELKPGMFAHVALESDLGERVQIPTSAIVYTGPRRLVFVDLGAGRLQPREIEIGAASNGMTEVRSGVKADETIVSSGVFLVAAEARIRTAATYWNAPADGGAADASAADASAGYTCPMHPEVVSQTPGQCPKCGMNLVPREKKP